MDTALKQPNLSWRPRPWRSRPLAAHDQRAGINTVLTLRVGVGQFGGDYRISGAVSLLQATTVSVGYRDTEPGLAPVTSFEQLAGQVRTDTLALSASTAGSSTHSLQGGTLSTQATVVGDLQIRPGGAPQNRFTQTGGLHSVAGSLMLGAWAGRTLVVRNPVGIGNGTLPMEQGGTVVLTAGQTLSGSSLSVVANATLLQQGGTLAVRWQNQFSNQGTHDIGASLMTVDGSAVNRGSLVLAGQRIGGSALVHNAADGVISGWGRIDNPLRNDGGVVVGGTLTVGGTFTNAGVVTIGGPTARLSVSSLDKQGTLQGEGSVVGSVRNGGTIDPTSGTLVFSGPLDTNTGLVNTNLGTKVLYADGLAGNQGRIQLAGGTFDNNGHALLNQGSIGGWGQWRAGSLANAGQLHFSGGVSAVTARSGAQFTGGGSPQFEGGLSIGASPGLAHIAGDVVLASGNPYLAEVQGLVAGTQFDQRVVDGRLSFGGTLRVVELRGFHAQAGDRFDLFDGGQAAGRFAAIDFSGAALGAGLAWHVSRLYATGEISVTEVPEAPTAWSLALGLAALAGRRRLAPLRNPEGAA